MVAAPYKRASSSLSFSTETGEYAFSTSAGGGARAHAFASGPPSEDGHHAQDAPAGGQQQQLQQLSSLPYPFERSYSTSSTTSSADGSGGQNEGGFGSVSAPALSPPLTDLLETFWESRLDLLDRRWKEWREGVKKETRARMRRTTERALSRAEVKAMENEVVKMRRKAADRVDKLGRKWRDAKTVRLRDKVSFVVGVLNLVGSSLLVNSRPDLVPLAYTIQCGYFLPLRIVSYSRKKWHYFLFDYCYWISALCNVFLWVFPHSKILFQASFCAAHGPLAWSVATWRNSMVFHSLEKMTSLFIHIYPPFVFTTIVHFMPRPQAETMFPALQGLEHMDGWSCFGFTCGVYLVWQLLYWTFISNSKKGKIESGVRINSYSTMTRGKGAVAGLLSKYPHTMREPLFMALQFAYTVITTLPAPLILYPSKTASVVFLLIVLVISVWNGATYYVDVWARKFERELLALRAEMELAKQQELAIAEAAGAGSGSADASRRSSVDGSVHHGGKADVHGPELSTSMTAAGAEGGRARAEVDKTVDAVVEKAKERVLGVDHPGAGSEENRKDR